MRLFGSLVVVFLVCAITISFGTGCASIWATRPTQEMSDMELAIQAAREVEADVLAADLYRTAVETATEAKREYRLKNFLAAQQLADRARAFAERAEFEAVQKGAKREAIPSDPLAKP